jgi:deoxyribonuclease V
MVEQATATGQVSFPYISGLLAFRELPTVLDALGALHHTPDLIVCDGYGIAHPAASDWPPRPPHRNRS